MSLGREDWDFVSMENYRHDMAENSAQAVAVISQLKQRERSAEHHAQIMELALADALKQLGKGAKARVYATSIARLPEVGPGFRIERELSQDVYEISLETIA